MIKKAKPRKSRAYYAAAFERLSESMADRMGLTTGQRMYWHDCGDEGKRAFIDWLDAEVARGVREHLRGGR